MDAVRLRVEPEGEVVEVPRGTTLFQAARELGIHITSDCGGHGECGKCFVRLRSAPNTPTAVDRRLLPADRLETGTRLACRYVMERDTVVYIPPGKRRQNRFA
ncbi:MAG TPA: 2Fe-2S iron-sulfur cluster-binding protein [Gammaproteobacteria bacterium]|nr:2Fe-2S iron-sulfur cluster-binding protein [Gammaproteobacteria bacterium]